MDLSLSCCPIAFATPSFDEALRLRYSVLRKPLGLDYEAEDIAKEFDSIHLGCYQNTTAELCGVLILKPLTETIVKMRQVAVHSDTQGRGVGTYLVNYSEDIARDLGFSRIELHAREAAVPFYKKLGYESAGPYFSEVGIPHLFMFKELGHEGHP